MYPVSHAGVRLGIGLSRYKLDQLESAKQAFKRVLQASNVTNLETMYGFHAQIKLIFKRYKFYAVCTNYRILGYVRTTLPTTPKASTSALFFLCEPSFNGWVTP